MPAASVAVYRIVVTPIGNADPIPNPVVGDDVCTNVTPEQLSKAVGGGVQVTTAVHALAGAMTATLDGQFTMDGGVTSFTSMIKVQVLVLPELSVPVKVTVVIPLGKVPLTKVPKSDIVTPLLAAAVELITPQLSAQIGLTMVLDDTQELGSVLNVNI